MVASISDALSGSSSTHMLATMPATMLATMLGRYLQLIVGQWELQTKSRNLGETTKLFTLYSNASLVLLFSLPSLSSKISLPTNLSSYRWSRILIRIRCKIGECLFALFFADDRANIQHLIAPNTGVYLNKRRVEAPIRRYPLRSAKNVRVTAATALEWCHRLRLVPIKAHH